MNSRFTAYAPALPENDGERATEYKDQYLKERAALMTPAQVEAIRNFLLFVANNAKDADWLPSFVDPASDNIWWEDRRTSPNEQHTEAYCSQYIPSQGLFSEKRTLN